MNNPKSFVALLPQARNRVQLWIDCLWWILFLVLIVYQVRDVRSGKFCAYMGTDYRVYYTAAQIARQDGFVATYDLDLQAEYQAQLKLRCPDSPYTHPPPRMTIPYLPVFVVLFLPLTALDFTTSYLVWMLINLLAHVFYLQRIAKAIGFQLDFTRLLQWTISMPVLSNLYLGQVNLLLLIFTGEFILAWLRGKRFWGGVFLGGLLLKPHTLILLIPGLVLSRNWSVLAGFTLSSAAIFVGSLFLGGFDGLYQVGSTIVQFVGPLIFTAPTMMNWRGLALNIGQILPQWLGWVVAVVGMILVIGLVLYCWTNRRQLSKEQLLLLMVITLAGTFTVAWHSHFYLLMMLVPCLLVLVESNAVPQPIWAAWLVGPPVFYLFVFWAFPDLSRNLFGIGVLGLNLILLAWSIRRFAPPKQRSPAHETPILQA
jgi:hypothetical protein